MFKGEESFPRSNIHDDSPTSQQCQSCLDHMIPLGLDVFSESLFFGSMAAASILFGFGLTLGMAKRKDPHYFAKVK